MAFMSENKSNNKHFLKVIIISLGILFVVGGIAPYIYSYFSPDELSFQNDWHAEPEVGLEIPVILKTEPSLVNLEKEPTKNKLVTTPPPSEVKKSSKPLPTLHESDTFFLNKIAQQQALFKPVDIIRNMVVFVDNFSRGELQLNFSPVVKPNGKFSVTKQKNITYINSNSYKRYDMLANAVHNIDVDNFIALYILITPLLDEAYKEIGYSTGNFTATFEKAIKHILETPIIYYKLELTSPSVMYQYADKILEALPDTQKLMLRMGPNNLQLIKNKLQTILDELQQ